VIVEKQDISEKDQIIEKLEKLRCSGGTSFGIPLKEAKSLFQKHLDPSTHKPVLLFLTDGESNDGEQEMQDICQTYSAQKLQLIIIGFDMEEGKEKLEKLELFNEPNSHILKNAEGSVELLQTFQNMSLLIKN